MISHEFAANINNYLEKVVIMPIIVVIRGKTVVIRPINVVIKRESVVIKFNFVVIKRESGDAIYGYQALTHSLRDFCLLLSKNFKRSSIFHAYSLRNY